MRRTDRLFHILRLLRDGRSHRAEDIADALSVSVRTIYRDMDALIASGVPVRGARGSGYAATREIALPPLNLSAPEFEALNLGIAIVAQSSDPGLKAAAQSLADKIDAALPTQAAVDADSWKVALSPFGDVTRAFALLPPLRAAIKARQKLELVTLRPDGTTQRQRVRPLQTDHWARLWTLTAWSELHSDFQVFRIDLVESATPLPELFVDEPGKSLADFVARDTKAG